MCQSYMYILFVTKLNAKAEKSNDVTVLSLGALLVLIRYNSMGSWTLGGFS